MFDFHYIMAMVTVGMLSKYPNDGTVETKVEFLAMCNMGGEL